MLDFGPRRHFGKNYRARNGFNVQCVFIPFNNHKIMFYKYLYVLKARVILENYNFCDRSQE